MIAGVLTLLRPPAPHAAERRSGSRSTGRCSASPAMRCFAVALDRLRHDQMVDRQSSATSCCSKCSPGLSFALAVLVPPARPADRAAALPAVRRRIRHQPIGQFRADHGRRRRGFRRHRGCPEADHLQLLRQHQQRGSDHLRGRAFDRAGQSDPGAGHALVRKPLPEEPRILLATIFPTACATCAKPHPRRNDRRDPRPRRSSGVARPRSRGDHRSGRVPHARDCRRKRSRTGASDTGLAQDYKSDICEATDKLFPIRVPLVPSRQAKSRSATCWSDRGRTARSRARTSRRRSRKSPSRSPAPSAP